MRTCVRLAARGREQLSPSRSAHPALLRLRALAKRALCNEACSGLCLGHSQATIGVDFLSKTMYLEDRTVRLQIWDTAGELLAPKHWAARCPMCCLVRPLIPAAPSLLACAGQERFRALAPSYIRDSQVAVVVYDVSSRASFLNVPQWIADARAVQGSDAVLALVGNKSDLGADRQVSLEEAEAKARDLGVMVFLETSAREGHNIKALFHRLASALPHSDGTAPPADANSEASSRATMHDV